MAEDVEPSRNVPHVGEPLTDFQGIMSGIPTYLGSQSMIKGAPDDIRS